MSIWDDDEIKPVQGEFVKFEAKGDSVSGVIEAITKHTFPATKDAPAKTVPQLSILTDDGEIRTLTAGQTRLLAALSEERPEAGDHLSVTLTDIEKRQGGRTLKHFDVTVKKATAAAAATSTADDDAPPF